jgi:hypothetical protein
MINDKGIRNALLLAIVVIAATLLTGGLNFHSDKKETWSIPAGNALFIATPCAASVTINADPNLHGRIDIIAKAHTKAQIMQLKSHGGAAATIAGIGSHCLGQTDCTENDAVCAGQPDDPNLTLTLTVPTGIALNITESQDTEYDIGDINAPLTLNTSGDGDINAATITSLRGNLGGDGDVHIATLNGPIEATLSKKGDLDIAAATAPTTNLTLNGDGDVNIDAGNLGALNAVLSKDGDLHLPAAQSATLMLSADGDVDLGQVAGNLTATLTGDGDLSVANVNGDATLTSTANGDVTIPHVGGHLTQSNTGDGDFKINGG